MRFAVLLDGWTFARIHEAQQHINERLAAKTGFLPMTNAIMDAHEEIKGYHFSNECNMLNTLVVGMSAKKYKEIYGVAPRDGMTDEQLTLLTTLQEMNTSLIKLGTEYAERKGRLRVFREGLLLLVA